MGEKLTKSEKFSKIVYIVVRVLSFLMIVFSIVALIVDYHKTTRADSRYVFIILQASAMVVLTFIPTIMMKLWKISCPVAVELIFLAFCSCALICGEIFEFYIKFSWWDDLLHGFSGVFMAVIGFIIINIFNQREDVPVKLSPGFVAWFSFFLAMACEGIWEVFEWTMDSIVGSNMQRYMDNITHEPFLGRYALEDTMSDIIEVMIGSIVFVVFGYFDMKYNKNKITQHFKMKKIENVNEDQIENEDNSENIDIDNNIE